MGAQEERGAGKAPLIITARDVRMLRFLASVRVATARDVCNACFSPGSLTAVRARLRALSGGADYQPRCLLYKFPLPSLGGNPVRVFRLTTIGRDFLAREQGLHREKTYRPAKERILSFRFLRHELTVTACVAAARLFARSRPDITLRDCRLSFELGRMEPKLPVLPDAWMRWERRSDGRTLGMWIEADCATQYQATWAKLFQARVEYFRSEAYKQAFTVSRLLVCYVVVGQTAQAGEHRVQSLCRWGLSRLKELKLEQWAGIFRFTSVVLEAIYEQEIFEKKVWHRLDDLSTPVPLFGP
jgi:hypothetical protein